MNTNGLSPVSAEDEGGAVLVVPPLPRYIWVAAEVYDRNWGRRHIIRRRDKSPRLYPSLDAAVFNTKGDPAFGRRYDGYQCVLVIDASVHAVWKAWRAGQPIEDSRSKAPTVYACFDRLREAYERYCRRQEEYRDRTGKGPRSA
jgi:hypothetical protein